MVDKVKILTFKIPPPRKAKGGCSEKCPLYIPEQDIMRDYDLWCRMDWAEMVDDGGEWWTQVPGPGCPWYKETE